MRFLAALGIAQAKGTPAMLSGRLGRGGVGPDPSEVLPPDSQLARETLEDCRNELAPTVVEHSLRSFVFARALGLANGIDADPEELFVAAMYHDYSFNQIDDLTDRCFTLPSAEHVEERCRAAGWEPGRAERVAEAVTMHINPAVPLAHGPVQHLVHDGIFLDILSLRATELDRAGVRRVFERHPRMGFNEVGPAKLAEHGRRVPACRAAAAFQGGFRLALKLAPG
ncbi:MAG TPA: HD domain-containing protein [Solirubrobacterales bacterium]|nr:HD domain-containing protein [Solirubrobacterales bacterium]